MRTLLILTACCFLSLSGCILDTTSENRPAPTDGQIVVHSNESEENQSKREQWIASIHRAALDVDWRSIEAHNLREKTKYLQTRPLPKNGATEEFANGAFRGEWKERGPSNQAGSMFATEYDPSDNKIISISAGGSLFKGSLDGNEWEVLSQDVNLEGGFLEFINNNGSQRLIAANYRVPHFSDDGGRTWESATGIDIDDSTWGRTQMLTIDKANATEIYAVSRPSFHERFALYKSVDNGSSYQKLKDLNSSNEDFYKLFSTQETDDHYFLEKTSTAGSYLLWKYDPSINDFALINSNFMDEQRQDLVNAPTSVRLASGLNRHYFYTNDNKIVFTEDEGLTSIQTGSVPATPWGLIYAPPSNPFSLFMGEVEAYSSVTGGSTWNKTNAWYEYYDDIQFKLHADIMAYNEITTNSGEKIMLISHHGGISKSYDQLQTTENITLDGVSTAQYYDVRTDPTNPNIIYAGSQDQGFQRSTSTEVDGVYQFDQLISGDYGKIVFTNNNSSIWTVFPDGDVAYFDNARNGGGPTTWYTIDSDDESLWLPPLTAAKNTSKNEMLISGGNINGGPGAHIIRLKYENQTIVPDQFSFDFTQDNSGSISALAISPMDENLIFTGTEGGSFFYSIDGGATWDKSFRTLPGGHFFYGAAILPSKVDPNIVYYGGSGYSNSGVLKSSDGGRTFNNIGITLPQTLIFDLDMNEDGSLIFAATETGPYVYVEADNRWYDITSQNTPRQAYWSVEYLDGENIVRFGTYGRGVWDLNLDQQDVAINDIPELKGAFTVYPNPSTGIFNINVQLDEPLDNGVYSIFNSLGQKVSSGEVGRSSQEFIQVNLTDYPRGNYILQIRDDNGIKSLPLSKQ